MNLVYSIQKNIYTYIVQRCRSGQERVSELFKLSKLKCTKNEVIWPSASICSLKSRELLHIVCFYAPSSVVSELFDKNVGKAQFCNPSPPPLPHTQTHTLLPLQCTRNRHNTGKGFPHHYYLHTHVVSSLYLSVRIKIGVLDTTLYNNVCVTNLWHVGEWMIKWRKPLTCNK